MNLVDKQLVVLRGIIYDCGEVGGTLDSRSRGHVNIHPEFARDDMRERGLAESGRSREQHMVEHFGATARSFYRHPENLLGALLAYELGERTRTQREIELAIFFDADPRRHASFEFGRTQRRVEIFVALTFRQAAPPMICELSVPDCLQRNCLARPRYRLRVLLRPASSRGSPARN